MKDADIGLQMRYNHIRVGVYLNKEVTWAKRKL